MKLNKKGFTMVEILATVTILGILTVVAVVGISRVMDNAKKEYYKNQEENIILAAQSFVQNNTNKLPKNIGQKVKLKLSELTKNKYLKETVKDYGKQNCDMDKSYVEITKISQKEYSYDVVLDCPAFKGSTSSETGSKDNSSDKTNPDKDEKEGTPTIDISFNTNIKSDKYGHATIKMTGNDKLSGYNYIVYSRKNSSKKYSNVKSSGNVEVKSKTSLTLDINLNTYLPSEIKIQVSATNTKGKKATKTATVSYVDGEGPTCLYSGNMYSVDGNHIAWSNKGKRVVTIGCIDTGVGCEKDIYTQAFTEDSKFGIITIKDRAGNATQCKVQTYLDATKPECKSSGGVSNWSTRPITLVGTCTDKMSGCKNGTNSGKTTYKNGNVNLLIDTTQNTNNVSPGVVYDNAGNSITCPNNQRVMVDVDKPVIHSISNPNDSKWATKSYTVTVTSSDVGSGLARHEYMYKDVEKKNWTAYANSGFSPFTTTPFTKDRKENAYIRACDIAGNCSVEKATKVMIDTVKPICTNTGGGASWSRGVSITGKCSDANGCKNGANSGNTTYSGGNVTKKYTTTASENNVSPGVVYDNAGNQTTCPYDRTVRSDYTAPSISINNSSLNNVWSTSPHKVYANASDAHSGLAYYEYRVGGGRWIRLNTSAGTAQTNETFGGNYNNQVVEFRACDKVGNCSSPVRSTIKVDTEKPTCRINVNTTSDYLNPSDKIPVKVTCSDNGGTAAQCGGASNTNSYTDYIEMKYTEYSDYIQYKDFTKNLSYNVKDAAGNSNSCSMTVRFEVNRYRYRWCTDFDYPGHSECERYRGDYYNNYTCLYEWDAQRYYLQNNGYTCIPSRQYNSAYYSGRCGYNYDMYVCFRQRPSYCQNYPRTCLSWSSWESYYYYYDSYYDRYKGCPKSNNNQEYQCQIRYNIYRY